jgi:hypothetical protein
MFRTITLSTQTYFNMKQLIFFAAFCLLGNLVFSQQPYAAALEKYPEIARAAQAAEEIQKQVAELDNANLRLDSTVDYSGYFGGDSIKTGYSLYSYPSAGTTVFDKYNVDAITQAAVLNSRNVFAYDAFGRQTLLESYTFNSGSPMLAFQIRNFWKSNSLRELDSIKMLNPGGTSIFKEFIYNANQDVVRQRQYDFNTLGVFLYVNEYNNTYQADGRIILAEISSGSSLANLTPGGKSSYTYSGDSTKVSDHSISILPEWVRAIRYYIHVPGQPSLELNTFQYERNVSNQPFFLKSSALRDYDTENRVVTILSYYRFFLTDPPVSYLQRIAHLQGSTVDFSSSYSVDIPTGATTLQSRRFYHYTDVSATRSPLLSPDAVKVMPNPAHDVVRLDAGQRDILAVEVLDATGRLIRSTSFAQPVATLETAGLPRGMVTLRVVTQEGVVAKVVVLE